MMFKATSWILFFSLGTVGCGASKSESPGDTSGTDAGADTTVAYPASCAADPVMAPGLLVPADFSRMTLHLPGIAAHESCPAQEGSTLVLDALTSSLSWDGVGILSPDGKSCQTKGQLSLTRTQIEAIWQVGPTSIVNGPAVCQGGSLVTLDVDRCGQLTHYVDSQEGCQASPDLIVATNVGWLYSQLSELMPDVPGEIPVFVAPEGFVSFTLHSSGGMPGLRDPRSTCDVSYKDAYSVDVATRTFAWDHCKWSDSGAAPATGSRTLTDDEIVRLNRALSFLKLNKGSGCGADKPKVTLDLATSAGQASYSDSFYACEAQPGEIFVDNIDELESVIFALLN